MTRKILTEAAAMEIKRLYELVDARGNRVHSQMEIASMLGVSETTVFRTIHRRGAYMKVRELPTDNEAQESERRFRAEHPELFQDLALEKMQQAVRTVKEAPQRVEGMLGELAGDPFAPGAVYGPKAVPVPPPSPLDELGGA